MINAANMPPAGSAQVWTKASAALRQELGEDVFGSWLAPAALRPQSDGALCLVTPTGIARDWIRRHAWRRVEELWAVHDPDQRALFLKSRVEFEASSGPGSSLTNDLGYPQIALVEGSVRPTTAQAPRARPSSGAHDV